MTLRERLTARRDAILAAATASGARNVRLFGSVARGEEREDSDVDFLVTLEAGRTLLDLARLELQLERILGRSVDVVTESSLKEPLRSSAMREAIVV
jgi:predicted nucleotidyltransferase